MRRCRNYITRAMLNCINFYSRRKNAEPRLSCICDARQDSRTTNVPPFLTDGYVYNYNLIKTFVTNVSVTYNSRDRLAPRDERSRSTMRNSIVDIFAHYLLADVFFRVFTVKYVFTVTYERFGSNRQSASFSYSKMNLRIKGGTLVQTR